jgi:hypothetical protein
VVHQKNNDFYIESELMTVTIYVNRRIVDFSRPVRVFHNNRQTVVRRPQSDITVIRKTIWERGDPYYVFEDSFISVPELGRVPL